MRLTWGGRSRTERGTPPTTPAAIERGAVRLVWWGAALAVLAGAALIAFGVYRSAGKGGGSRAASGQAQAVVAAAQGLELAMENAERAQRAYLLTGKQAYFAAYRRSVERASARLARLEGLTAAVPAQHRRVALLGQQVALQLAGLARTIEARRRGGVDAARRDLDNAAGFDPVEIVIGIVSDLVGAENAGLSRAEAHRAAARARRAEIDRIGEVGLAAAVLLGVGLVALGFGRCRRLQRDERRAAERRRLLSVELDDHAITLLDPSGRLTGWSPGAERLTGYRAVDMLGRDFAGCFAEEARAAGVPARSLAEAAQAGRVVLEGWRPRADGAQFWSEAEITALHAEGGRLRGYAEISRDVTDRRRREAAESCRRAQGARAERLNALTRLAAELLAAGESGGGRAAWLRTVAQRQDLAPQDVDIAGLLGRVFAESGVAGAPEIAVEAGLWPARIDPTPFAEAMRAMVSALSPGSGSGVTIIAGNTCLDAEDGEAGGPPPGRYVALTFAAGADERSRARIGSVVEPFAAAEGRDELSAVYGFVRQSGGDFRACSMPEKAVCAVMLLPAVASAAPAAAPSIDRRGETVLVALGDPPLRGFAAAALATLGYRPIEVADGAAALGLLEHHREISAMLADLGLAGPDPRAFAEAARERIHHLKILFVGGRLARAGIDRRIFAPGVDLLAKPFTAATLRHGLARLLNEG